jgi:hypothetical protein
MSLLATDVLNLAGRLARRVALRSSGHLDSP